MRCKSSGLIGVVVLVAGVSGAGWAADKVPNAEEVGKTAVDEIARAYHGQVYGHDGKVIDMDYPTLHKMQASLFDILVALEKADPQARNLGDLSGIFHARRDPKDELAARNAVLQAHVLRAKREIRDRYGWRADLIRRDSDVFLGAAYQPSKKLRKELELARIPEALVRPAPARGDAYNAECLAQKVPLPPDWPSDEWIYQGTIPAGESLLPNPRIDVYAAVDAFPDVHPGACMALPRWHQPNPLRADLEIKHLGIICQSALTGHACFWDNTVDWRPIRGKDISFRIRDVDNGSNLVEKCTNCHRGSNAFVVRRDSILDLRASSPGGPYDTTAPGNWYIPIGGPGFENPGPLVMPSLAPGSVEGVCDGCHKLAEPSRDYCEILRVAATRFMPSVATPAGWPSVSHATHVGHLQSECASLPPE